MVEILKTVHILQAEMHRLDGCLSFYDRQGDRWIINLTRKSFETMRIYLVRIVVPVLKGQFQRQKDPVL